MGKSILLDGFSEEKNGLVYRKLEDSSEEPNSDHDLSCFEIDLECEITSSITALAQDRTHEMFDFLIRWIINLLFSYLQFVLQYSHTHEVPKTCRARLEKQTRCYKMKEIVFLDSRFSAWIMEEVLQGLSNHYSSQDTHCVSCSFPETIRRLGFILGSLESQDRPPISLVLNHHHHQKDYSSLDFIPLFDNVATNTTLKHLNIGGLQVDEKSAECLVKCLQENQTLQILILTDCGLSVASITLLLENLGLYPGLRRLYLNGRQKHGLTGHQKLVDLAIKALKTQNCTLEALFMPPGFDLFRSELDMLLDWNLGGRRIMLRHQRNTVRRLHQTPQFPRALWSHVFERINTVKLPNSYQQTERRRASRRADMIFLMLRQDFLLEA